MGEINLCEVQKLIPSINENIGLKRSTVGVDFFEVCEAERMLMKVNEDIKNLLFQIDGEKNINDIVNIFNPPTDKREDILELVYYTLLKLTA